MSSPLAIPPLRERKQDIPLLLRYFVQKYARKLNRKIDSIPSSALEYLTGYSWPGNIRELQNVVERSVILTNGSTLRIDLPEFVPGEVRTERHQPAQNMAERERILQALDDCNGIVAGPEGAAARLGLKRTTLQSRMKKLNISREYH